MTDLMKLISKFSRQPRDSAANETRLKIIENIHDIYNKDNVCVQSRLTTTGISFRGKGFTLNEFAFFFKLPPILILAIYDEYGGDSELVLSLSGRPAVTYLGRPVDKEELGNRYAIPWKLLDEHVADTYLYNELIKKYTSTGIPYGDIGNPKMQSGSDTFAKDAKNVATFKKYLQLSLANLSRDTVKPERRVKSDSPISAAQASL